MEGDAKRSCFLFSVFVFGCRNDFRSCGHARRCNRCELKPDFEDAHYNLGLVLLKSGDLNGAQAEFQEAVRLKPRYAEAHYNLALAFQKEGKASEARAISAAALIVPPITPFGPLPRSSGCRPSKHGDK